jgi:hypothetical protein
MSPAVKTEPDASASAEFMLAEYSLLGELWRHTDARIETAVNFYLTTGAILGPATLLVYQAFSEIRLFLVASILVCIALIVMGLLISTRIVRAYQIKRRYAHGLSLIRRYFVDIEPKLEGYIHLPVAGLPESNRTRASLLPRLVIAVRLINSLALGWILAATTWLLGGSIRAAALGGIGGVVIALLVTMMQYPRIKDFINEAEGYSGAAPHNTVGRADA